MFDLRDLLEGRFFNPFQIVLIFQIGGLLLEIGGQQLVLVCIDMGDAGFECLQAFGQCGENGGVLGHGKPLCVFAWLGIGQSNALTAHRFAADQNHAVGQQGAAMRRKRWCCDSSAFKGR